MPQVKASGTAAKVATVKRPCKPAAVATTRRMHPAKASTSSALTDTAQHEHSSGTSCQEGGLKASMAQRSAECDQQARSTASYSPHRSLPISNVQPHGPGCHGTEQQKAHPSRHSAHRLPDCEASSSIDESADADTDVPPHARSRRESEACSIAASMSSSTAVPAEQQRSGQTSRPLLKQVAHWLVTKSWFIKNNKIEP